MKKIITIISITTLIFLVACGGNTDKSAAELAPEGMDELTFGYGYTAYKTMIDYQNGDTSAEDAKVLLNGLLDQLEALELTGDEEGYNLSVEAYIMAFTFNVDNGAEEDLEGDINGLKEVLQIE